MKGIKKNKKLTAKEALADNQRLELENQILRMNMEKLNSNWALKFDMIIGIFQAALDDAGTLGEAKRWFGLWTQDINAIDADADDSAEQMAALIDKHGFTFTPTPVTVSVEEMTR